MDIIEKRIGRQIRELRKEQGISQIELAGRMGLSFQQIQKYEKGITKISVSRLYQIADALGVNICVFFEKEKKYYIMEKKQEYTSTSSLEKEEKDLISLFRKIENQNVKQGLMLLLQGIVEEKKEER